MQGKVPQWLTKTTKYYLRWLLSSFRASIIFADRIVSAGKTFATEQEKIPARV
jgi:hypothetical protein